MQALFYIVFYGSALITLISTLLVVTRYNAVHALLYLIISSLSTASLFYLIGAPFAAALEIIIYAGAVMILFVFVVMMLNLGQSSVAQERSWTSPSSWFGPSLLALLLMALLVTSLWSAQPNALPHAISAKEVGIALFGPYLLIVELASFLLLSALVGAYHLTRSTQSTLSKTIMERNTLPTLKPLIHLTLGNQSQGLKPQSLASS